MRLLRPGREPEPVEVFRLIGREKAGYSVKKMCRALGVSRSGYYQWVSRKPSAWEMRDMELKQAIKEIHDNSRGAYGSPRIHAELRMARGMYCSRKRVVRLMQELGIRGARKGGYRGCTRRNPKRESYPDLVQRQFAADAPNKLWVADMTERPTLEGVLYLAVIIDVFSRMVVGWSMGERKAVDLVISALNMAVRNRWPVTKVSVSTKLDQMQLRADCSVVP